MNHPARELTRQTRTPANPNLRAATAPVVANTRRGTNQWIAIWRMGNSTVNIALNTQFGKDGHTIERIFEPRHDAIVIGFKEMILGFPGAVIIPNNIGVSLLIDTNKPRLLLHTDIARDQLVIANNRELLLKIHKLRHVIGHEIMVSHRRCGDIDATPLTDLASVGTRSVDNVLTNNIAMVSRHTPLTRRQLLHVRRAAVANHCCTELSRTFRQRHSDTRWIDVTVVGGVERTDHTVQVVERMHFANTRGQHEL